MKCFSKNILICLMLATCLIITACASTTDAKGKKVAEGWQYVDEGIRLESKFTNISVSTDVISIRIEPSLDDSTHIHLNSSDLKNIKQNFNFEIKETNDQLKIAIGGKKTIRKDLLGVIKMPGTELNIQLPANEYAKINVSSDVGRIEYTGIDTMQLEVDNEVGQIVIRDSNTEQVKITNSVGSVNMYKVNGKMDIKNSTGSVQVHMQNVQRDINVKADVGAVTIVMEQQPEHIKLNLSTDLGSVKTNLDVDYDKKTKSTVKGHKGANGPEIKVSTDIGKIEVTY